MIYGQWITEDNKHHIKDNEEVYPPKPELILSMHEFKNRVRTVKLTHLTNEEFWAFMFPNAPFDRIKELNNLTHKSAALEKTILETKKFEMKMELENQLGAI